MLTLADIVGQAESVKHTIRGKEVNLRALTAAETNRVRDAFPEPVAPPGPDPSKGSRAPWIPNTFDAKYVRERSDWLARVIVVELAFGLDYKTADGSTAEGPKPFKEWASLAYDELTKALTDAEITRAIKAHQSIGSADVVKN